MNWINNNFWLWLNLLSSKIRQSSCPLPSAWFDKNCGFFINSIFRTSLPPDPLIVNALSLWMPLKGGVGGAGVNPHTYKLVTFMPIDTIMCANFWQKISSGSSWGISQTNISTFGSLGLRDFMEADKILSGFPILSHNLQGAAAKLHPPIKCLK